MKQKVRQLCIAGIALVSTLAPTNRLAAQIVPDTTLPSNSIVIPNEGNLLFIEGGTTAGGNLFHSFEGFSVPANSRAIFNNSPEIQNIFSRVTGSSVSNIDGILGANGLVNLFFLNPNGIVFGPNAQLQIGGSFLATTANSIEFANGSFSAANPEAPPLLVINIPTSLEFGSAPGTIVNRSQAAPEGFPPNSIGGAIGLAVPPGRTLALAGGDVTLENGNISAFGGRIELGSVAGSGSVSFIPREMGFALDYEGVENFANIRLSQNSVADASGLPPRSATEPGGRGGEIQVRGNKLTLENSGITSTTFGTPELPPGGDVTVTASEIELSGSVISPISPDPIAAGLFSQSRTAGLGGNLTIQAQQLTVRDGAQVSTTAFVRGQGGSLTVMASNSIELIGTSVNSVSSGLFSNTEGAGNAGNLAISTANLTVRNGAEASTITSSAGQGGALIVTASESIELGGLSPSTRQDGQPLPTGLSSQTEGDGDAGDLIVKTGSLFLSNRGVISTASDLNAGDTGNLSISAASLVQVGEGGLIVSSTAASNPGGSVTIDTRRLIVENGGQILATTLDSGRGGNLTVNAAESVELIGTRADGLPSGLFTQSQGFTVESGAGDAGNLNLSTRRLTVTDGATISADTFADGLGGSVTIHASESIQVTGRSASPPARPLPTVDDDGLLPSRLSVFSQGSGNAGSLNIETERLTVDDKARIAVDGRRGTGAAGSLEIAAPEISLDAGILTAQTASGGQGNITLNTRDLQLRDASQINTNAGSSRGGNINIDTSTLAAVQNSDITANAQAGSGGRVSVNAQGIFGTEFQERLTNLSDITATSDLGPQFDGVVDINTPDIDPSRGLVELEEELVDVAGLINQNPCRIASRSRFVDVGKGGLPPDPAETLSPTEGWEDWRGNGWGADGGSGLVTDGADGGNGWGVDGADGGSGLVTDGADGVSEGIPVVEASGWELDGEGNLLLKGSRGMPRFEGDGSSCLPERTKNMPGLEAVNISQGKPVPETFAFAGFEVRGSTVFGSERLAAITERFANEELTFEKLLEVGAAISELYKEEGYIGSGAVIPPQTVRNGIAMVRVVENKLEADIEVATQGRLTPNYVKGRLGLKPGDVVNREELLEALRLLQLDPLIEKVSAELSAGLQPNTSFLEVRVEEAPLLGAGLGIDNGRSPSVGTFRRQARVQARSLLGLGDIANLAYTNTDGSDTWDFGYTIPINASNGSLGLRYSSGASDIIEPPFDRADIEANSRSYELTYRQPLIETIQGEDKKKSEFVTTRFAVGLSASRQESETSLLGFSTPLSPGANDKGETRISALRFFQEWTRQENRQIFAARSQFSLGVGWFNATVNNNEPDSRFFSWRGQGQWVRKLGSEQFSPLLLVEGDMQLSPSSLVPLEQFSLGGQNSVRGYRQDARLADNGAFASVELRYPILPLRRWQGVLEIIPFLDAGVAWNSDGNSSPSPNSLVGAGLGLQLQLGSGLRARLDWGVPLVDIDSRDRTWQENGLYFSVESGL